MNREEAIELLKEKVKNPNLIKHSLAVESCMRELAAHFGEDKEKWGLAGLLHDIDYEETKNDPEKHSILGADFLKNLGLDNEIVNAVRAHNDIHGIKRETLMEKSLFSVDPLTGLIVAATLVLPSKKIKDLTVKNVLNRFKEKSFARGAKRENILRCTEMGLNLEEFISICLKAMQKISDDLGL